MQEILTTLFFFLAPIFTIDVGVRIVSVDLFDLFSLGLLSIFVFMWFIAVLQGQARSISGVDLSIFAFCFWCLAISIAYFDTVKISDVAKFVFPPLTYVLFKSMIKDRAHFVRCMRLMLIAFLLPTIWSVILIFQGQGLDKVNYWTGLARYQGVFVNPHNFGHAMTFMLMVAVIFVWFRFTEPGRGRVRLGFVDKVLLALILVFGLFALYQSYVRTAWSGLLVFLLVFAYIYSKKLVIAFVVTIVLVGIVAQPILKLVFHDVAEVSEGKRDIERIGSGRPYIWSHNFEIFKSLRFDRQLAGVGIGNRGHILSNKHGSDNVWNSHNDFLEVMMQTGVVGLLIFLIMQFMIYLRIVKIPLPERLPFIALFFAIMFMNFMSNSYVVRYSIGQMFYMLLAYIESAAVFSSRPDREANAQNNEKHRMSPRVVVGMRK